MRMIYIGEIMDKIITLMEKTYIIHYFENGNQILQMKIKKWCIQLKDFNRKLSNFIGKNYDDTKNRNAFYDDFKYNYDSYYDETPESIFAKANKLYPKYIKYFYTDQEYYSKVEEYINLYEFQKNSTYILGKDLEEFLEEYITNKQEKNWRC